MASVQIANLLYNRNCDASIAHEWETALSINETVYFCALVLPYRTPTNKKGQARFTQEAEMFKLMYGRSETRLSARKGLLLILGRTA